jgi:surface antigen
MLTMNKSIVVFIAATVVTGISVQTVAAQPGYGGPGYGQPSGRSYNDGFRDGYRQGYDDGGIRARFDDRAPNLQGPPGRSAFDDQDQRWRQRYQREYTYTDDNYYRQCRTQVDPGGVIAGALIGGLLGNALGRGGGRGGATIAGVVAGGALGAALTRNLNCEDQSYAYKTYYDGFNSGRTNVPYQWRNPNSGNYGEVRVNNYANDQSGFRCANFTQQIYIQGRPQAASGRACQQPDGTWAIVG